MAIGRFNLSLTGVQPGGLVYVGGTSFSAASTVSLDNVFSSTYDNYKCLIKITGATAQTGIRLRLRASSTDKSTSTYYFGMYGRQISSGGVVSSNGAESGFYMQDLYNADVFGFYSMDILSPYLSTKTACFNHQYVRASDNQFYGTNTSTVQTDNYSADGCSLVALAANITGEIKVYGYRNDNN